jgi:hypothetical protein
MRHIVKAVLAGCLVAVALVGTGAAGPFEDGLEALDRGDYATAFRDLAGR